MTKHCRQGVIKDLYSNQISREKDDIISFFKDEVIVLDGFKCLKEIK